MERRNLLVQRIQELVIGQKMVDPIRCRSDNKVPLIRSRINYVGAQLLLQFYWK